jgi:hypothetical protein
MAEESTIVIFRKYPDDEVIALFPEIPADNQGLLCLSYMHVGQHGHADCSIVSRETRPASPSEYAPLKKELESIGYVLEVRERITPTMKKRREQETREIP